MKKILLGLLAMVMLTGYTSCTPVATCHKTPKEIEEYVVQDLGFRRYSPIQYTEIAPIIKACRGFENNPIGCTVMRFDGTQYSLVYKHLQSPGMEATIAHELKHQEQGKTYIDNGRRGGMYTEPDAYSYGAKIAGMFCE